ncbi:MAG: hypothetical protein ACW99G_19065 [Candidatus Thorarchaeota archaeon]|jgi:hypothetical protein
MNSFSLLGIVLILFGTNMGILSLGKKLDRLIELEEGKRDDR